MAGSNPGERRGGRQKGTPNKSTAERDREHDAIKADVFGALTEAEIQAITPRDMFRLVARVAVRQSNVPLILKCATDWAPYMHAKLAPLIVEPPKEPEEERARRLHEAMKDMRETVGEAPPKSEGDQPSD